MKVVIDCNVLVSPAWSGGVCGKVIVEAVRRHEIVLSDPIVDEYETVSPDASPTPHTVTACGLFRQFERVAIVVEPAEVVFGLNDPDDEVYLATTMAGGAVLITGNRRDFTKPRYGPIEVFSPRDFLNRMTRG